MTKSAKGSEKITRPSSAEDLKKAIDRPIGQPEPAREEQPIGWVFDPDGDLSPVDGSSGPGGQPVDTDQLGPLSGKLPEEGREAGATSAPDDAASRYVGVSGRSDAGSEADQSLHPQTAEPVHIATKVPPATILSAPVSRLWSKLTGGRPDGRGVCGPPSP